MIERPGLFGRHLGMRRFAALVLTAVIAGCAGSASSASTGTATPTPSDPATSVAPSRLVVEDGPLLVYQGGSGLDLATADGGWIRALFTGRDRPPSPAHADWSPDGRRLAFQAGVDGSWDIWITSVDGDDAGVLVDCVAPCLNMDGPAWSPDGSSVAFTQLDETAPGVLPSRLRIVDVATGEVRTIAEPENGVELVSPRWSPDGERIVLELRQHRVTADGPQEQVDGSAVVVVDLGAADPTLTRITGLGGFGNYPDWHPSGDRILFSGGEAVWDSIATSITNLFTVRPDGSDLVQLTTIDPYEHVLWLPAWTPDGRGILATQTVRTDLTTSIVRLEEDGSGLEPLPILGAHARLQPTEPGS